MRALVFDGSRARIAGDAPAPTLQPETALVRVTLAGICATDLQILAGYMGFRGILGHEFVGRVSEGPPELIGQRVVGEINFACRRCATCAAGRPRHCPSRSVMGILGADGAFAELVRVPVVNLHPVPDAITDREAVFTEPLAAAFEAAQQTTPWAGGRTAVLGAGKLGLLVAQVLAIRGDRVTIVCRDDAALARIRQRLSAALGRAGIGLAAGGVAYGFDLVVEATGSGDGLARALALVRPEGAIVLKSTIAAAHSIDLAPAVIHEVSLIGSRCGPFPPALDALARHAVEVAPLIDAELPLTSGVDALARASAPAACKVLLRAG